MTISFISVSLFMCMQLLGSRWTDFRDMLNVGIESKTCWEINV